MALRKHLAAELGLELQALRPDQGPRLQQILWRLGHRSRRAPGDIDSSVAYGHALALAGKVDEAREEALRLLSLMTEAAPLRMVFNVVGALADAGLPQPAMQAVDRVAGQLSRADELEPLLWHATHIAVRFGQIEWYGRRLPPTPLLRWIHESGLMPWWDRQQQAIERVLGRRVATTVFDIFDDQEGGAPRISLEYHTDLTLPRERGERLDAAIAAVAEVYASHPEGPGAFLGRVLLDVQGPEIPLPESEP